MLITVRIIFVGIFWSIFFLEGIRVIMLTNWHFDIFMTRHWRILYNLWENGWTIRHAKEWAFILIILTFIPLWLTGWAALSLIAWDQILTKIFLFPIKLFRKFFFKPVKIISTKKSKTIKKKKSYKEIRPRGIRAPIDDRIEDTLPRPTTLSNQAFKTAAPKPTSAPNLQALSSPAPAAPKSFDHSLFQFDDDSNDDFDFNFDAFDTQVEQPKESITPKPEPVKENNRHQNRERNNKDKKDAPKERDNRDNRDKREAKDTRRNQTAKNENTQYGGSTLEIIKQKGYEVITGATLKNNLVDFVGVANKQICICMLDKEPGDWLADEERFNDEEPLWFSESSHRISPVRKIDLAKQALEEKLKEADLAFTVTPYVIVQLGNIINAEDMLDIWKEMKINVTRIDRGTPKELKLFAKALNEADGAADKENFEKIKKLIRNIA